MTSDEQEAASFRYIAPRIFMLSSGNIAIIPMIGRGATVIVEPKNFYDLVSYLPTMNELEALHRQSEAVMRARQSSTPKPLQPTLDDLA